MYVGDDEAQIFFLEGDEWVGGMGVRGWWVSDSRDGMVRWNSLDDWVR